MSNYGLVSIITPAYNTGKFIAKTIESVQAQTYQYWEMIIVDDCSTDDTIDIAYNFQKSDKRIKVFQNPSNMGAATSRNTALRNAKGRWIAFLDSDDLWKPTKLEKQLRFMIEHGYSFSCTERDVINEQSVPTGQFITGPERVTKWGMYRYCWIGCLTVIYDAKVAGLIQIPDLKKNNDYAIWLKVIKKCDCYLLKENLASYRQRKGSISHDNILKLIKSHYTLWRVSEDRNPISACIFTFQNLVFGIIKKLEYIKKYDT